MDDDRLRCQSYSPFAINSFQEHLNLHLYLIRHAESENNARPEHERVEDPAITQRGELQAAHLAKWLAQMPLNLIVVSPFRRALQTVRPILSHKSIPIEVSIDIVERGGCYRGWQQDNWSGAAGFAPDEIISLVPDANVDPRITSSGWWTSKPRESDADALRRACNFKTHLETHHAPQHAHLAVITHAEFQRLLMVELLRSQGIAGNHWGAICNAGITHLTYQDHHWQLQWLNSVSHLPHDLVTEAKG